MKRNRNITYRRHYHVVWCPKYQRKVLTSLDPKAKNPPVTGDPVPQTKLRIPTLWTNSYFITNGWRGTAEHHQANT